MKWLARLALVLIVGLPIAGGVYVFLRGTWEVIQGAIHHFPRVDEGTAAWEVTGGTLDVIALLVILIFIGSTAEEWWPWLVRAAQWGKNGTERDREDWR